MNITAFWSSVLRQDAEEIRAFFHPGAHIHWHCTNECFTVEEFIRANCEYPGNWDGEVERIEQTGDWAITVTRVFSRDDSRLSFHAVSFMRLEEDRIAAMDEYWGDDGPAPLWRQEKHIGTPLTVDRRERQA